MFPLHCLNIVKILVSVLTSGGHRLTVLSKPAAGVITSTITPLNKVLPSQASTSSATPTTSQSRPVMRVPPLITTVPASTQLVTRPQPTLLASSSSQPSVVTRPSHATSANVIHSKNSSIDARLFAITENVRFRKEQPPQPQSIFHLVSTKYNEVSYSKLNLCEHCMMRLLDRDI